MHVNRLLSCPAVLETGSVTDDNEEEDEEHPRRYRRGRANTVYNVILQRSEMNGVRDRYEVF